MMWCLTSLRRQGGASYQCFKAHCFTWEPIWALSGPGAPRKSAVKLMGYDFCRETSWEVTRYQQNDKEIQEFLMRADVRWIRFKETWGLQESAVHTHFFFFYFEDQFFNHPLKHLKLKIIFSFLSNFRLLLLLWHCLASASFLWIWAPSQELTLCSLLNI